MATESADERADHLRSLTVTSLAAIAGIFAAFGSVVVTAGSDPAAAAQDRTAQLILLAAVAVQFPLLRLFGIDPSEFGTKDILFVAFMTFSMWFVTWAIVLTASA